MPAWSLALLGVFAAGASAELTETACPFTIPQDSRHPNVESVLPPRGEECRAAFAVQEDFLAIRAAIGYGDADATFNGISIAYDDSVADFDDAKRAITIAARALSALGREPALRRLAIAHEMGHAKQQRDHVNNIRALPDVHELRGVEAQADAFAFRFLAAAGYPPQTARDGLYAFYGYLGERANSESRSDHPAPGARYLNLKIHELKAGPTGPDEPSLAQLNERGILRAELWVPGRLQEGGLPTLPPGMTDQQFRQQVVAEAVKLLSDTAIEKRLAVLAVANRGTDLTLWVTRQAIAATLHSTSPR